jgi:formylglycine-generating enzyme required for sulfatase activity
MSLRLAALVAVAALLGCHDLSAVPPPISRPAVSNDAAPDPDGAPPTSTVCPSSEAPHGWVCVGPGTFMMGSPTDEPLREDDEVLHQVTLTRAFWLKATEVTQSEWQATIGANPSFFKGCGGDCPVESITWFDMVAFANALSLREGLQPCYTLTDGRPYDLQAAVAHTPPLWPLGLTCPGYRLPTEAEWEYAARAGTETAFYDGPIMDTACTPPDPALEKAAWYCANGSSTAHPVGMKIPNAWGLYDMLGNVWEPVWDWYADYDPVATDPVGPPSGTNRVVRGGSFDIPAHQSRVAFREYDVPESSDRTAGFRLARSIP